MAPNRLNEIWALDFMHDALYYGRRFLTLNVLDEGNREGLPIEVGTSVAALQNARQRVEPPRGAGCARPAARSGPADRRRFSRPVHEIRLRVLYLTDAALRRGAHNRLGFAYQVAFVRVLGIFPDGIKVVDQFEAIIREGGYDTYDALEKLRVSRPEATAVHRRADPKDIRRSTPEARKAGRKRPPKAEADTPLLDAAGV